MVHPERDELRWGGMFVAHVPSAMQGEASHLDFFWGSWSEWGIRRTKRSYLLGEFNDGRT